MDKPNSDDIARFHRYFAIQCNNTFWAESEKSLNTDQKQSLLTSAFASLFHWQTVGTEQNTHLAVLAVARAYCVNESLHGLSYAKQAFEFFDQTGEIWIQAFTNAVLSHALCIGGEHKRAVAYYETAVRLQADLSEGDRRVFDATFRLIPNPES